MAGETATKEHGAGIDISHSRVHVRVGGKIVIFTYGTSRLT
jgi:sarcosine oxidase gamma subunit